MKNGLSRRFVSKLCFPAKKDHYERPEYPKQGFCPVLRKAIAGRANCGEYIGFSHAPHMSVW